VLKDLDGFNVQAAASYNVDLSQSTYLAPFAAIQYGEVTTDSFTEEGGLNLEIDELDSEYIEGRIGVTVGKQFRRNSSLTDYYLKAAVVNDFGSGTDDIALTDKLATTGSPRELCLSVLFLKVTFLTATHLLAVTLG